ncbi:MAG: hypothetical protein N4J56_006580 [Chroococcidiopsis sp. SAG 2025]|uniref:hypothetical protein n=1 Tax=Chroococcidiopsis sp. SAG 2025 TaxID=171389 RepID=UPI00293718ED|nr:hypothetical protein [Chroococcidiopsis sp. SAG 2025]MDV2996875.1 hypothetical protein [Chroococcidiopsis sp. SAG 2025]
MTPDNQLAIFQDFWGHLPVVGERLEILDRVDYDVYNCTVTRIENNQIYIKRDDRDAEELADVMCLQTPSTDENEDWDEEQ